MANKRIVGKGVKIERMTSELSTCMSGSTVEVQEAAVEIIRRACKRVGIGIDDYLKAIKDGLKAGKVVEEIVDGMVVEKVEPEHLIRLKSAAMGLELEGYLKGKVGSETVNNYFDVKALVQQWKQVK